VVWARTRSDIRDTGVSDNELRERIAGLLITHPSGLRAVGDPPDWPWAVADAILAIPGIAVVELPEPDAELPHPLWALVFDDIHADDGQVVTHTPGGVYRSVEAPKQARKRAAALLAAAEHAEREQ